MQYQDLLLDIDRDVAVLTLDRPKQLNTMSARMLTELISAASDIAASQARAVVVSGSGRSFCAGVDLEVLSTVAGAPDIDTRRAAFEVGGEKAHGAEVLTGNHTRDDATTAAEPVSDPESVLLRAEYLARVTKQT